MLRFQVKPSTEAKLSEFPIREFYVAPDFSYISGVTDYNYGIVTGEKVLIKSPYIIGNETNTITCNTVRRQGKLKVSIEVPVKTITKVLRFDATVQTSDIDYGSNTDKPIYIVNNQTVEVENATDSTVEVVRVVTCNYVEYNGDISYFFNDGNNSGYLINGKYYHADESETVINVDEWLYVEDGKIKVGDYEYEIDFNSFLIRNESKPELRYTKYTDPLKSGDFIGYINDSKCRIYGEKNSSLPIYDYDVNKWHYITKFSIGKKNTPNIVMEDVAYGKYRHFITYNNENFYLGFHTYTDENGKTVTIYGVEVDGVLYNSNLDSTSPFIYDEQNIAYVSINDVNYSIRNSLSTSNDIGRFLIMMVKNETLDFVIGNKIQAASSYGIKFTCIVEEDDTDENIARHYILHMGKRYEVEDGICDEVTINGENYILNYISENSAYVIVNHEVLQLSIDGNKAKPKKEVYYKTENSINYGINENGYEITKVSGVIIDGIKYPVKEEKISNGIDGKAISASYSSVTFSKMVSIDLTISNIVGSNMLLCYPSISDGELTEEEVLAAQREMCALIIENKDSFNYSFKKETFGRIAFTPDNMLYKATTSLEPYTASNSQELRKGITIQRISSYMTFQLPLTVSQANNLSREDQIKGNFVNYYVQNAKNDIVDMEKDVYCPVACVESANQSNFIPINEIRFNLHFRTRDLTNWKVYEDDRDFSTQETESSKRCNWFITDYKYYKNVSNNANNVKNRIHNSSDLLGLLGFTESEIKNRAKKLGKSFLRLSFYSTDDPKTQVLLGTSTVFFNEQLAFKKYMDLHKHDSLKYIDVVEYESATTTSNIASNLLTSSSELSNNNLFDDDARLSSQFRVFSPNISNDSSEGYYLYMFKNYSTNKIPQRIYMRVEFNHAGIGKTIPMMLPRDENGKILLLGTKGDYEKFKDGYSLTDIYKQVHIPLGLKFDENTNKYVYYLCQTSNNALSVNNNVMLFNLFEVKFKNEAMLTL